MDNNWLTGLFFILGILVIVQVFFFLSIVKALNKVNRLNPSAKDRIVRLNHYIALVRQLSQADLINVSGLSDEELEALNHIDDVDELIKTVKAKIVTVGL